jgi:hypothetical protein
MTKKKNEKKLDRLSGVGCLLINLLFWPGLGTLIAGKIKTGAIQMSIFLMGILISYTPIASILWSLTGSVIVYGSILSSIATWIWSLISGIQVIKNGHNPRIKNNYVKIIILVSILLLLAIVIYFYISYRNPDIEKMSMATISQHLMNPNFISKSGINRINSVLDQKFQRLGCSEAETIDMTHDRNFHNCNYDNFWHYIAAKTELGMKSDTLNNGELISLLNRTYNEYKPLYASKNELNPDDNKWNYIMNSMIYLNLLNNEEKDFWVHHYASLKFDENQQKFPQTWNRIWMFRYLDIDSVYTLASKYNLNVSQVKENICSYIPSLNDTYNENLFRESEGIMFSKYLLIKHFCDIPFTEEDKNEVNRFGAIDKTFIIDLRLF